MCFGCSKEPAHWDGSFEYPPHMFWMRNKENSFPIHTLIWSPVHLTRKDTDQKVIMRYNTYCDTWVIELVNQYLRVLLSRGQLLPAASCSASGDDFDLICREIGWTLPYLARHNAVAPSAQLELPQPFLWNQTLDDNFDNVMLTSQKPCQHKKTS